MLFVKIISSYKFTFKYIDMLYRYLCFIMLVMIFISTNLFAQEISKGKSKIKQNTSVVNLKNGTARLSIDTHGGAIVGFTMDSMSINPYSWKLNIDQMPQNNKYGAVFQGHFLCLGRWGAPTLGEMKAGVPHNGQSVCDYWIIDSLFTGSRLIMSSKAPLDGILIKRTVWIDRLSPVFKVTENVKNTNSVGRLFNIVQHATIGSPFLDSTTIINTNAKEGFMQTMSFPNPTAFEYSWPIGFVDSTKTMLDLTKSSMHYSYVSTHIFADSIGWVTASSPKNGLLIGYIWKTSDYPWINIWNQVVDGKLWAKGLEFGTTGIGKSYQDLLSVDTRFHGRSSFFFLDATDTVEKSYIGFQLKIPSDFSNVSKVTFKDGVISIIEKNKTRNYILTIPSLFELM